MGRKFSVCLFSFLAVALLSSSVSGAGAGNKTTQTEEEEMIDQVESMGKAIQQALSKIANQLKAGGGDSNAAKLNLEKLGAEVTKTQSAMKGQAGRQPATPGQNQETMKTLQSFLQNFNTKLLDNVNSTIDRLEKMGDDTP